MIVKCGGVHMSKVLIVDDEVEVAMIVSEFLSMSGLENRTVFDGKEALEEFEQYQPDLILLDVMLPEIDGIEVCKQIRKESTIPIIMVSARKSDTDKILALGLGADDYVSKPFSMAELVARIRAQLRRSSEYTTSCERMEKMMIDDIEIDWKLYKVTKHGKEIELSVKEIELLKYLINNCHQVLSKEQIYNHVWGYKDSFETNTVVVHVNKIREKLEENPKDPKYIKTVWGVGYRFEM